MTDTNTHDERGRLTRRSFLQAGGAGVALAGSAARVWAGQAANGLSPAASDPGEFGGVAPDGSIDGLKAKFTSVEGIRTRYYEAGDAKSEPLVLIHGEGFSGHSSANVWSKNIPGLGQSFHVFAADKLASGMTGNPPDDKDYNLLGEVEHMYRFIRTMGLSKVHLVGQSRGGGCAFFLAVFHPEVVKTLVIVDSMTAAPPGVSTREQMFAHCPKEPDWLEWQCRLQALSFRPEAFSESYFAAGRYMASLPKSQETVAKMKAGAGRPLSSYPYFNKWKMGVLDRIRTEDILQVPVLLYWARNDPSAIWEQGRALFDVIGARNPRVRMLTTNKAGHFHFRENPKEWNFHVTRFIQYWNGRTPAKPARMSAAGERADEGVAQ